MVGIDDFPAITVYGSDFRPELLKMYEQIEALKCWNTLGSSETKQKLSALDTSHSAATFSYCLACMQQIRLIGLESFKKDFSK